MRVAGRGLWRPGSGQMGQAGGPSGGMGDRGIPLVWSRTGIMRENQSDSEDGGPRPGEYISPWASREADETARGGADAAPPPEDGPSPTMAFGGPASEPSNSADQSWYVAPDYGTSGPGPGGHDAGGYGASGPGQGGHDVGGYGASGPGQGGHDVGGVWAGGAGPGGGGGGGGGAGVGGAGWCA